MPCGFEISIENTAHYAEYVSGQYVEEKGLWIAGGKVYKHAECNVYAYCLTKTCSFLRQRWKSATSKCWRLVRLTISSLRRCSKLSMEMFNGEIQEASS